MSRIPRKLLKETYPNYTLDEWTSMSKSPLRGIDLSILTEHDLKEIEKGWEKLLETPDMQKQLGLAFEKVKNAKIEKLTVWSTEKNCYIDFETGEPV